MTSGMRLSNLGSLLPYHSHVNTATVVGGLNHLIDDVSDGRTVFYDFYTEKQKAEEPAKSNTGLFFLRGKPGAPFAVDRAWRRLLLCRLHPRRISLRCRH